jgi:hypothetical protein
VKRAAVIIGVDQTGDFPKLYDAARGARLAEKWARQQAMETVVLTDERTPVEARTIKDAVKRLVDAGNLDQLVIYFAGHGVNRQRQEYWLLSGAPDDTQEAVNVAGTMLLATTCGIPHIVLISDACRTAADGIRAQSVNGCEIFPNREEPERPVDIFLACRLGQPSNEVRDVRVTSTEYRALYTNELIPALMGQRPEVVEWTRDGERNVGVVRMRALRDFVSTAVSARLQALNLHTKIIQEPIATISSDPAAWLSRFSEQTAIESLTVSRGTSRAIGQPPRTDERVSRELVRSVLTDSPAGLARTLENTRRLNVFVPEPLAKSAERLAQPFGPTHQETRCGFKVRGARIVEAHAASGAAVMNMRNAPGFPAGEVVQADRVPRPGVSVLLVFADGTGTLLPAIPDFLAALTIEGGELVDVTYEPSDNTSRWQEFQHAAPELRALRAIISASMTRGVFKLEAADGLDIARRMQQSKGIDPSLAVYAAYAYQDLNQGSLIREMAGYMESDLGAPMFDVAMLARRFKGKRVARDTNVLSPTPLLSQGWALLSAYDITLPPNVDKIRNSLLPSLWTMLDPAGVDRVREAIADQEVR